MITKSKQEYFPFLDSFRALAMIGVVIYHIEVFFDCSIIFKDFYVAFLHFANAGELGVDMFFVISGFLISGLLYDDMDDKLRIKRFYIRRAFKILPQYYIATLVGIIISANIKPFHVVFADFTPVHQGYFVRLFPSHLLDSSIISHILFLQNFWGKIQVLGHTWSLAVEEHFYFIFPLILLFLCQFKIKKEKRTKYLLIIYFFLILIAFAIKAYIIPQNDEADTISTFYRFDALIFGCLIRLLLPKLREIPQKYCQLFSKLFFLLSIYIFLTFVVRGFHYLSFTTYPLAYIASGSLIISYIIDFENGPYNLKSFTENHLFRSLGKISYGVYLWHYILIFIFGQFRQSVDDRILIILFLISSFTIGYLSTITIEKYFLKIRDKIAP